MAQQMAEKMDRLQKIEKASAVAASVHRKTHLLVAGKMVSAISQDATLANLADRLPDGSRTLISGRLEPVDIRAEHSYGVLQGTDRSVYLPGFYQAFLVNTLKKERLALMKARKGASDDEIPLSDLADRLMRAAQA